MSALHQQLAAGRWLQMSLAEQIGNIGSEFSRARNAEQRQDDEQRNKALERAIDLIDLTLACPYHWTRLKEINRLRELTASQYIKSDEYQVTLQELEDYTLPFALLARSRR